MLSLRADIQKAVERGEIPLGSAYVLAKLPMVQQAQLVALAKTIPAREFVPVAARLVKQIQEAARQGKLHDFCKDFEPVPHLRPLKEVLAEYREHRLGGLAVVKAECKTPVDGWYLALEWALESGRGEHPRTTREIPRASPRDILERRVEPCDDETSDLNDNDNSSNPPSRRLNT